MYDYFEQQKKNPAIKSDEIGDNISPIYGKIFLNAWRKSVISDDVQLIIDYKNMYNSIESSFFFSPENKWCDPHTRLKIFEIFYSHLSQIEWLIGWLIGTFVVTKCLRPLDFAICVTLAYRIRLFYHVIFFLSDKMTTFCSNVNFTIWTTHGSFHRLYFVLWFVAGIHSSIDQTVIFFNKFNIKKNTRLLKR